MGFLRGGARPPTSVLIEFIDQHRDLYGVEPICRVLTEHAVPIAPSTYYEARSRAPSRRTLRDAGVLELIGEAREHRFRARFGARKMWLYLRACGHEVARCTIERLMSAQGWSGARRGRRVRTTTSDPGALRAADLVERDFTAPAPNRLWVADFTYVATWSGTVYVAFVFDVFSRRIVGWRAATRMNTELVMDCLEHAIWTRNRDGISDLRGLVHHTDAGSQGGFNWSSQHLDHGGVRWDDRGNQCRRRRLGRDGSGPRTGRCGRRCAHRAGPSRRALCSGSSGGWSRRGSRRSRPLRGSACRRRSGSDGSATLAG
uniref:IS3 family transposase n=1 Tax=Cumulibacter manganitolerans TaxID=1884992 RepID=UPI003898F6BE